MQRRSTAQVISAKLFAMLFAMLSVSAQSADAQSAAPSSPAVQAPPAAAPQTAQPADSAPPPPGVNAALDSARPYATDTQVSLSRRRSDIVFEVLSCRAGTSATRSRAGLRFNGAFRMGTNPLITRFLTEKRVLEAPYPPRVHDDYVRRIAQFGCDSHCLPSSARRLCVIAGILRSQQYYPTTTIRTLCHAVRDALPL